MRPPLTPAVLLVSLVFSLAGNSTADIVYSSLAYPLQRAGPAVEGTAAAAESQDPTPFQNAGQLFGSNANYEITSVTVGVFFYAGDPGFMPKGQYSPDFDVWLYSDQEIIETIHGVPVDIFHEPKDPIVEIAQGLVASSKLGLVTATATPNTVFVNANELRWIVLTPANPYTLIGWASVNAPAPFAQALQVEGTLLTPEPASLGLFSLALLAAVPLLWIFRSRRRSKHSFPSDEI